MLNRSQSSLSLWVVFLSVEAAVAAPSFKEDVQPVIRRYCVECHGPEAQEGNVRLDDLEPDMVAGPDADRWHHALNMINLGKMPPEDAEQPGEEQLVRMVDWIQDELARAIESRQLSNRAMMRRLTRQQYTNTLQHLLGVSVDFGAVLPEDGKSRSGFTNNASVLTISPLHLDYYQRVAREALAQTIFTELPPLYRYHLEVGEGIGEGRPAEKVAERFGGYVSQPIDPKHVKASVLDRAGRALDVDSGSRTGPYANVYKNLGFDMRGSHRHRYVLGPAGMMLDSAVPHKEVAPGSWHGPSPNLKMLIRRDFPAHGDFVLRVKAARIPSRTSPMPATYKDKKPQLELKDGKWESPSRSTTVAADMATDLHRLVLQDGLLKSSESKNTNRSARFAFQLGKADLYHVDVVRSVYLEKDPLELKVELVGSQLNLSQQLAPSRDPADAVLADSSMGIMELPQGEVLLKLKWSRQLAVQQLTLTPLADDHPIRREREQQLAAMKEELKDDLKRQPVLQVSLGNRTDDGQDARQFGRPQKMTSPMGQFETYEFHGRLENLPVPQVDLNELSNLANIMVLTVWNGDMVKDPQRAGSRVVVQSMEFEGPFFPEWPPASHKAVFFDSPHKGDPDRYAREILERFMARAFRRPVSDDEVELYHEFWRSICGEAETFEDGVKEALVAVLCSPKFLFLVENATARKSREKQAYELASRLSYFLWNGPPDDRLLELAGNRELRDAIQGEVLRMSQDPRAMQFVKAFCDQWLRIDRHKSMQVDVNRYPAFTRFVKADMAEETYRFFHHVLVHNKSVFDLVDSDYVLVNQNLAEFYGIEGVEGTEFRAVPVDEGLGRGGLMTQGSFLSGHSDGRQAHPIKRAVWLMERLLGESPPPPPPNVPGLEQKEKDTRLTIAEQLAEHRDNVSCRNCHKKLDPYGLVFENYDGAGLRRNGDDPNPDVHVVLPDGAQVAGVAGMKVHILKTQRHTFLRSLVENLMVYALGRDMSFVDDPQLEEIVKNVESRGATFQVLMEEIVQSPLFLQQSADARR